MTTRTDFEPLLQRLLDGFRHHSRDDGTVHTIYSHSGTAVAEVCVGRTRVRLNFRMPLVGAPKTDIVLQGRSQTWKGQGCVVTAANVEEARLLIAHVSEARLPAPVAERPTAAAPKPTFTHTPSVTATPIPQPIGTGLTGAAGEYYVAAELSRRGWLATVTIKNAPGTDVLAQRLERTRLVAIQTKTASPGSRFRLKDKDEYPGTSDDEWYVLVSLGDLSERPTFFIVPRRIVAAIAYLEHREWLAGGGRLHRHARGRARQPNAGRTIKREWIEGYRERWDLLDTWRPTDPFLGDPAFPEVARALNLPKYYGELRGVAGRE